MNLTLGVLCINVLRCVWKEEPTVFYTTQFHQILDHFRNFFSITLF